MFVRVLSHTNTEWNRSKSERESRRKRQSSTRHNSCRQPSLSPRHQRSPMSSSDIIRQKGLNDERKMLNDPKRMPGECRLTVEVPEGPDPESRLHTSTSMTSLNIRVKKRINRIRHNQCVGIAFLLTMGILFNFLAYMASVWSAELNSDVIEAKVAKHEQSLNYKIKKVVSGEPSKYLIGLLNFGGRMLSAVGTLMLVQVIITLCQLRRGRCVRAASGNADELIVENIPEGTVSETIGECFMGCISF